MSITKTDLPTHEQMVENILAVWGEATEFDRESGTDWYANTRAYCTEFAKMLGYNPVHAIGAYAVISPSLNKEQNDSQFIKGLVAHKVGMDLTKVRIGVYGRKNREKFARCLDGDVSAVGGDKVTRFFKNICGDSVEVTVDRWAVRVALRNPTLVDMDAQPGNKAVYMAIRNAYVSAAEAVGVEPHVMQAVTWECYRNKYYRRSNDAYKRTRERTG